MKVLAGIYQKDARMVTVLGLPAEIFSAREAQALGISIIHQELNLMRDLSIAQKFISAGNQGAASCWIKSGKTPWHWNSCSP